MPVESADEASDTDPHLRSELADADADAVGEADRNEKGEGDGPAEASEGDCDCDCDCDRRDAGSAVDDGADR